MTHKKVPGAEWVYMVYDNRDRLVMTQDGEQRNNSPAEWTFTKYDELNRPILTGIYKDASSLDQDDMQGVRLQPGIKDIYFGKDVTKDACFKFSRFIMK